MHSSKSRIYCSDAKGHYPPPPFLFVLQSGARSYCAVYNDWTLRGSGSHELLRSQMWHAPWNIYHIVRHLFGYAGITARVQIL